MKVIYLLHTQGYFNESDLPATDLTEDAQSRKVRSAVVVINTHYRRFFQ